MNSDAQNQIVVRQDERKHAGKGTLAIVHQGGTALVTKGGRARVADKATAIVLRGGTFEFIKGAAIYVALKLQVFVQVPPNEVLNGLDPRTYRAIYDYTGN
jgi:hypothetical protein